MSAPMLVTAAIAIQDDKILVVRNQKLDGLWSLPGGVGGWKEADDPVEAVKLEVRGDVGAEFVNGDFFTYRFRSGQPAIVTLFFVGAVIGKIEPVCKNIIETKLVTVIEVGFLPMAYEHGEVLRQYVRNAWSGS